MDFTLSDEQELLRTTARALMANECPPSLVRAHIDDRHAADAIWDDHLRDWVALGEGSLVDLCLFVEEMGAALTPGPFFATTALFVPLLRAIGHDDATAAVAGEVVGTVAMAGSDGLWTVNDDPQRTFVLDIDRCGHVAVVLPGPSVAVLRTSTLLERGGFIEEIETLDTTRRTSLVTLPDGLEADAIAIDPAALDTVVAGATVVLGAELMGAARWLEQASVAYAKERVQFGRPIGSFQGVQYKLVDMALDFERALAAVYYAAMAVDAGDPDRVRAVHVAKAAAGRAARHNARDALQVHGGIGYTYEHDLHLYLRRAYACDALLGPTAWHEDRLADLLFD